MPYELTDARRLQYRETSIRSAQRKVALLQRSVPGTIKVSKHRLDPADLAPQLPTNGIPALSLFSGGGGLDLGFERAGFGHVAAYDILDVCGQTLRANRPSWKVFSGDEGDITGVRWSKYRGEVEVVHGGPPCQPFSIAGSRLGSRDPRNMWPGYIATILDVRPRAFIAENVPGMLDAKFSRFVSRNILQPLRDYYTISMFRLSADRFGVPQARKRVFIVGFRSGRDAARFVEPVPTHYQIGKPERGLKAPNMARRSLGLPDIGFDTLAPTLRSGFTGPRNTTGVINSKASLAIWNRLQIWPNGVQKTSEVAALYPPENGHQRLSVADCAMLQGFSRGWQFEGAVYQALGQIGNSVCPPVAYWVARAVARALGKGQ
jgi:DNA (cytosine-5)-methyltransferase 1